ncbi:MAG: PIG-L family deacetylase [Pirellulaceae bacterium]|nr:PIG-L family deacetylase [Pirellulaceae bacterium]
MNLDNRPMDVVAVGAHPDDIEIACGGTLARLVRQGYRVGIVDLTDGEPTPRSPGPDVRLAEAKRAAEVLGVHERLTLDFPNRRLFDSFEARVALAKVFRRWRPQVVIGFGDRTPTASPDHWQAMQITDAAVFYAKLTKWPEHFDGLPEHTVSSQLYFSLGMETTVVNPAMTQFVVDIGDSLALKMKSVRCYQTQFPPEKDLFLKRIESIAVQVGAAAGFLAGETFISTRPLGAPDLMQFLFPPAK